MKNEYNIVLKEKPYDMGLTKSEVMDIFDMLSDTEAIPIEIQGECSTSMGFISLTNAEKISYDYSKIEDYIKSILNDMNLEHENNEYEITDENETLTIYLSR